MKRGNVTALALSGYNFRAVVALCRFAKKNGFFIDLIAKNTDDPVYNTDYKEWVLLERDSPDLSVPIIIEWIEKAKKKQNANSVLILPTTEFLNRLMLNNRKELERAGAIIPLTRLDLYEQISNKLPFSTICESFGLRIPRPIEYASIDRFPLVAKPKTYAHRNRQQKPYLIFSEQDLVLFGNKEPIDSYYFQEYLAGPSYYLLYHLGKNRITASSQKNLVQQSGGGSIVAATQSDIHRSKIANEYEKLLQSIGFNGLIMIELREYCGDYYMIEANPRFWGPLQLIVDSDDKLIYDFFEDNGISCPNRKVEKNVLKTVYFWSGGLIFNKVDGRGIDFHDYDATRLLQDYPELINQDIYLRPDSLNLFYHEMKEKYD